MGSSSSKTQTKKNNTIEHYFSETIVSPPLYSEDVIEGSLPMLLELRHEQETSISIDDIEKNERQVFEKRLAHTPSTKRGHCKLTMELYYRCLKSWKEDNGDGDCAYWVNQFDRLCRPTPLPIEDFEKVLEDYSIPSKEAS